MLYLYPFILLVTTTSAVPHLNLESPQWLNFKNAHHKHYSTIDDELFRLEVFQAKLAEIDEHNQRYEQGLETWWKAVNQFSDWTNEEWRAYFDKSRNRRTGLGSRRNQTYVKPELEDIPEQLDWREDDLVTEVKDEKYCVASWAFAVVGSLEAQYAKVNNVSAISFSTQNIIDCARNGSYADNWGCGGGYEDVSYEYVIDNGLNTEADYPYMGIDARCVYHPENEIVLHISSYTNVSANEGDLQSAVANIGPVGVSIFSWYIGDYGGGIAYFQDCPQNLMDHSLLVVGYGTDNGTEYWLLKNDWGTTWGEAGYMRLRRNANNQCGIATDANFPTV